jgi:proton glutamate symport protein
MNLWKAPLHVQILIALIFGVVLGAIFNPGELTLDQEFTFPLAVETDAETGEQRILIAERADPNGPSVVPPLRLTPEEYGRRFPKLPAFADWGETPPLVTVSGRSLRIMEDSQTLHVQYARKYNDQSLISNAKLSNENELKTRFPTFVSHYEEYREGWSRSVTILSKWLGDLFLRLLKMVTIPLIVSSLITGVAGLGGTSGLGSMFSKTLGYYLITSLLAITTGIIMVNLIQPGVGATLPGTGEVPDFGENQSLIGIFSGLVDNMIPPNPVAALANGDFLSIITFSILFGVFIILANQETQKTMTNFFSSFFQVVMGMTMFIIHLAPIGVLAFMTYATASQGAEIFGTLAWYMLTVFLALLFHFAVTMPLILKFVAGRNPLEYVRALSPALMTAFSTASSNGTLPLTMTCVEKNAGVSNRTSSFVLPLGATINMDGTALYEAVAVLFIAQATAGFELSLSTQVIVALTALLASIGAAGIPHAGLVMMTIVLQAVGLPLDAQGIIIAVDRVLDMCRTAVNVWSDSCGCAVVERLTQSDAVATEGTEVESTTATN